ncbi:hypothetical protein [Kitasatospora sp. NPDC090091]|uniref:hypothetical protein n=1 Tax=Kitasatospora sp. NPDC090091 TaxID=3364081 RepID=UPI00380472A8
MTDQQPYAYELTATNAHEALNILDAVRKLVEARVAFISPDEVLPKADTKRAVPISLRIGLDEFAAVQAAHDIATLNAIAHTPHPDQD